MSAPLSAVCLPLAVRRVTGPGQSLLVTTTTRDYFDSTDTSLQRELRAGVDAYFKTTGRSRYANGAMALKTAFFLLSAAAIGGVLISGVLPFALALPLCLVLGAFLAGIGFNVGHDAIHGAWSPRPWVNRLLGYCFDLIGASSAMWAKAHNVMHHTYTNISGVDSDLEPGPWLLFYEHPQPRWFHRFQHWFCTPLYALTTVMWILKKDAAQALTPDLRTGKRSSPREIAALVAWKLVHVALFLVLPWAVSGYAWWQVAVGYLAMHAVTGATLAIVFQLAHVVEGVELEPRDAPPRRYPWAEHQLRTTADFAPDSAAVAFYCGGLNRQIEHHLFARICHIHYPALAPIVREVAARHGIPYVQNPSLLAAFASHLRMMKRFGRPPATAAAPAESLATVAPAT